MVAVGKFLEKHASLRVNTRRAYVLEFEHEPFPYTRLNFNSRWTTSKNSQEGQYIAWKDYIRDLFDQLDYRQASLGIPLHEPLEARGFFHVTENWEGKDLDNLIKGAIDALNITRKKDWKDLRTFMWVDDRQILRHSGFEKIPSRQRPLIHLEFSSFWEREDPHLNWAAGPVWFLGDDLWSMSLRGYPFHCKL